MTDTAFALPPLNLEPKPFICKPIPIKPDWIDYNGHLNMAYYHVIFDLSVDQLFAMLGLGPNYLRQRNCSTMTAECHVRYIREVGPGDPVHVVAWLLETDDKRLHTFEELRHSTDGWLAATSENMSLHIDMSKRKVGPFPSDIRERLRQVVAAQANGPQPEGIGRRIAMPGK